MRKFNRSPTTKSVSKVNHSQDPLLILTPPSSLREITNSYRLNRHLTIQRSKVEQFEEMPHQYRNQLQKLYQESFIKQLLERVQISNKMNNYQKQVLDDLHFGQDTQIDDIDNVCYKFMFNYFKHYPLIQPQSYLKLITDLIYLIITFIIFIWLPFKYSFNYNNLSEFILFKSQNEIEYIFIVFQLIEIIIQLNLASINNGKLINQRYHIIYNYIKQNLFKDIISLISLIFLLFNNLQLTLLILLTMIIYFSIEIQKIYQKVIIIQEYFKTQQLISLLFNFMIIIYLIHILSCIQYRLNDQINEQNIIQQYLECFNWASVYLTSGGLSNIQSENIKQLIFSSFVSILSLLINGYITIKIGFYIFEEYQQQKHNKFIQMINKYMYHNKININLQNRIRSYLQYIYKQEKQMEEEDVTCVVNKLSQQLKNELKYQLQANLLEQCTLISQNFSIKLRKQLIYYMEEIKTVPEQRILTLNEVDDNSIYLINKGEVNIVFEKKDNMNERYIRNNIKTLSKGEYFGFYGFISGNARTASIISKGFCQLYKIQRIHFINLLEQFPDDKEIFCMMRDNVEINKDLSNLKIKCYSCKSTQHLVNNCPYLHFIPDHDRVIKQQLYPIEQERDDIQRKCKYINALLQKNMIADVARQIMQDLENPDKSGEISQTESESEDNVTKTIKSTSNLQSKSLSKSLSQFSAQMSRVSHRPSQTLTIPLTQNQMSIKSQEEIGRFEQEILKKMSLHKRSQQQKETAGFGARFESQMHNPIMENDEEIPCIDAIDEEASTKQQEIQKSKQFNFYHQNDRSPRIYRRVSQKVSFDQNLFGFKGRRSSLMYETYVQQMYEESFHEIEFPIYTQPSVGDFDKIQEFRKYYPQYNISWVMKMIQKYNQGISSTKVSLYTFLNLAIKKGLAIKNKLNSLSKTNIRINIVNQSKKLYKKNKIKTMLL